MQLTHADFAYLELESGLGTQLVRLAEPVNPAPVCIEAMQFFSVLVECHADSISAPCSTVFWRDIVDIGHNALASDDPALKLHAVRVCCKRSVL